MKKFFTLLILLSYIFNSELFASDNFLSLKKDKVNVRYGPGFDYPIKYIYEKKNLPVKLIDNKENWRRIIDSKSNSGWIHWRMLKKINSFIILEDKILFYKSSIFSKPILKLQKGRLLIVKKCKKKWCNVKTDKYSGWVRTNNIWGKTN